LNPIETRARGLKKPLSRVSGSVFHVALRLIALATIDAIIVWFVYQLVRDRVWFLAAAISIIALGINVVFLLEKLYPFRWLAAGLAFMALLAVYPVLFTVYTAFTNYSDGHLLTKQQVIHLLAQEQYLPEGAPTYHWIAYRSDEGKYALWLIADNGDTLFARPGEPIREMATSEAGVGPLDEDGVPKNIADYNRLSRTDSVRYLTELGELQFGEAPNTVRISSLDKAACYQQRYIYKEDLDVLIDSETGLVYHSDEGKGYFVSPDGQELIPGYQVVIGWRNFQRLLNSPALRGPFIDVFAWTVAFGLLSALSTFILGLFFALVFDAPTVPGRKLFRSALIIPYAIPGFISILVWVGMLNPELGIISRALVKLLGWAPPWFSDPGWAKIGVLLVNLWLGFPYMMLICSGALQAIPRDLYEVAEIDGAGSWQRFWNITLPLLLVSVGPLLIGSFAFNFNNFVVIYLFNKGGPPMVGTQTPVGHTDILISYTYRLAFASGRGADFGYAATISTAIFLVVAIITAFNFRFTRIWEEVSENV
jgi:ABC-type sugar transport system permease subunit